jgi:hypothetical protein
MELALLLYAASIADNLRSGAQFLIVTAFLAALVGCAVVFFSAIGLGDVKKPGIKSAAVPGRAIDTEKYASLLRINRLGRKLVVISFYSWVGLMFVAHFVPYRKDVFTMAGGYVVLKAVRSDVVQDTSNVALNAIEQWLDKEMENADIKAAQAKKGAK